MNAVKCLCAILLVGTGCFSKPDRPDQPGTDAADGMTSHVVGSNKAAATTQSALSYTLPIIDTANRFLIVAVQIGTNCDNTAPNVIGVSANTMPLNADPMSIVGTPCGGNTTTQLFTMVNPPTGTVSILVQLDGFAKSIHTAALAIDGVDQADPIRNLKAAKDTGARSAVQLMAEPADLVVDFVGAGNTIDQPGTGQTKAFIDNQSGNTTLDNTAASSMPAVGLTTMLWTFTQIDEWQAVAVALRPAP